MATNGVQRKLGKKFLREVEVVRFKEHASCNRPKAKKDLDKKMKSLQLIRQNSEEQFLHKFRQRRDKTDNVFFILSFCRAIELNSRVRVLQIH